jgi:hypothetical protein
VERRESGGKVLYIKRYRKLALASFAVGMVVALVGFLLKDPAHDLGQQALGMGFTALLIAVCFQRYSESFLIDALAGTLVIEERRIFHFVRRRELPLAGLRVQTSSLQMGSASRYYVWLEYEGRPRIRFVGDLRDQRKVQELVGRLRADLRGPGVLPLPPTT